MLRVSFIPCFGLLIEDRSNSPPYRGTVAVLEVVIIRILCFHLYGEPHKFMWFRNRLYPSPRRLDVLVQPEEICRIIPLFNANKPAVVGSVASPHTCLAFIAEQIDRDTLPCEWLDL